MARESNAILRLFLRVVLAGALFAAASLSGGDLDASGPREVSAKARADDHLQQQAAALGLREDLADLRAS